MDRVYDLLAEIKTTLKEQSEKENNVLVKVLAVVGAIAALALIGYLVYRFLQPDYYEDYDDNVYDDEYEDDAAVEDKESDDFEPNDAE